jgi:pimeloyl-ACP methyl ester carboxylesterase
MCSTGCALLRAGSQVSRIEELRIIAGKVAGSQGDSVVVVALRQPEQRIVDFFVLDGDGKYMLDVSPGSYRVLAFADRNGDRIHQLDEPAAYLTFPPLVDLAERVFNAGFDLTLPAVPGDPPGISIDLADPDLDANVGFGGPPPGTVVPLSDARFARENGEKGLWRPIDFMLERSGGLFFLEPYDAKRTPVLFIHGAGGTPRDFTSLIERLDRERFQAWALLYPSALRLKPLADFLNLALRDLRARLGFKRVLLVAHSMGGMVVRAFLNKSIAPGDEDWAPLFVSISTPWQGHAAAETGVQRSPVVLPSWRDMAPSSVFVRTLFQTPLPKTVEFHLFFGFEGHRRFRRTGGINDGVVAIASQLASQAQRDARRLHGFASDHTEILRNPEVSEILNALLAVSDKKR